MARISTKKNLVKDVNYLNKDFSDFRDNLIRIGPGMVRYVFTTFVLLSGHPAGAFFWPKIAFPKILDMVIFQKSQFSSKTDFLSFFWS